MHVYGHPTALLSDTGIAPLYITQNLQLAQLRFRLCSSSPTTIQHFLWCLWQPLLQAVPLDTLEDRMQNVVGQVDPPRRDPNSPMPHNVSLSKSPSHTTKKSHAKSNSRLNALTNGGNISRIFSSDGATSGLVQAPMPAECPSAAEQRVALESDHNVTLVAALMDPGRSTRKHVESAIDEETFWGLVSLLKLRVPLVNPAKMAAKIDFGRG